MAERPQSASVAATEETAPAVPAADDAAQEPSLEDLLKPPPDYKPLPKWNDPELRYAPRGADPDQPRVSPGEAWRKINTLVEKYDKGMCESYREQIDTLLVFAGLFSAVVTAFAVDSYKWLQDDPTETSAELMQQAVTLLSALANQPVPVAPPQGPSLPASAVVRINIYWFLSLVLSLSAALVGIVCKQWLREYERDVSQSAKQALGVRQVKFEGMEYWRVGSIVTSVPLLLQLALALFLIGISELLWHLHRAVAIAVTTVAGLTAAFYLATALLPLLQYVYLSLKTDRRFLSKHVFTAPQCPYKSPQAWLILRLFQPVIKDAFIDYTALPLSSWITFDTSWTRIRDSVYDVVTATFRALAWADRSLGESHLSAWIFLCAREEVRSVMRSVVQDSAMQQLVADLEHLVHEHWRKDWKLVVSFPDRSLWMRGQGQLLSYSYWKRFNSNLSVELLLQLIPDVMAYNGPAWLTDQFDNCLYLDDIINDDLAFELVRSLDQVLSSNRAHSDIDKVSSLLVRAVQLIGRAPTSTATLLPALCAILLKWLQTFPSGQYSDTQRANAAWDVLKEISYADCYAPDSRSFCHIAALAQFMLEKDPNRHSVRGMLKRLGLLSLYDGRPHLFQHLPAHEGTHSDTAPETAPDVQTTHPVAEHETRLTHVPPGDSAPLDTSRSSLSAVAPIGNDSHGTPTVPDAADIALAVTPPRSATQRHAEILPTPVAPGALSSVDFIRPSVPAHAEIDMDIHETVPAHSTPTTQSRTEALPPLVAAGSPTPIHARRPPPPPHTEIDIEMGEPETSPSPDEPDELGTYHRDVVGRDS